jgi:citrate synthase
MTDRGGLEGVVVARSRMCSIDGVRGVLVYAGYDIRELAAEATYEEVAYLLMKGELPTREQLAWFGERLREEAAACSVETERLIDLLAARAAPMEMLRTAVSSDSVDDPRKDSNTAEDDLGKAIGLIARMPMMIARYHRRRLGLEPVAPDPELGLAENFLWMMRGERPSEEHTRTFDVALILHADHEMNASTFTARVIASTLSDLHSAVTGAIGALKGSLHGGANERVMQMLDSIGDADPRAWIEAALARGERIMGFGHRVYKTWDPRALILKEEARRLAARSDEPRWFDASEEIERVVIEERGLYPNVDFYSASTYRYLGIPTDLFTPIFAMSRVAGWSAHVIEQHGANRLIRPSSEYVGPGPRPYAPLDRRVAAA